MMDINFHNRNYKKNPFNFQHYNLIQIRMSVSGEEVLFKPLKLNFDDKLIGTALAATINVLIYAEYDNIIEIDSN